ncbi:MAG: alpha/beta fold hydrolase [Patescibacteria group bacterium]
MEDRIKCGSKTLNIHIVNSGQFKLCILFLSGGVTKLGKERYYEWQENLKSLGISSVSFDYSGVNGSGDLLKRSSLESRVEEGAFVADWMKNHICAEHYILYGVSMGGYIALGLTAKRPGIFKKLILHAPAAYPLKAHGIPFGEQFTEEIKRGSNREDSLSFDWLREYDKPTLLIESENDEVIPEQIIERYRTIKGEDKDFKTLSLKDAPHDLWGNASESIQFRNEIYNMLLSFIK